MAMAGGFGAFFSAQQHKCRLQLAGTEPYGPFRMSVPAHLWLKQKSRFLALTAVVPLVFLQLFCKGHREITFVGFLYALSDREVTHSLLPNEDQGKHLEAQRPPTGAHRHLLRVLSVSGCTEVCFRRRPRFALHPFCDHITPQEISISSTEGFVEKIRPSTGFFPLIDSLHFSGA